MTEYLSVEQVVALHEAAAGPAPLLDRATLTSAVLRPQAGFGGEDAHPTLHDKAAALLHGLASTQCFQDGNKRVAWIATVVFLEVNGANIVATSDIEAEAFVIAVATSAWTDRTVEKAAEWLADRTSQFPARHPQLDYAFLAAAAASTESGQFNALGAELATLATSGLPIAQPLAVVSRILWTPGDAGRAHRLTATLLEDDDQPVPGAFAEVLLDPPTPGAAPWHPNGFVPVLATPTLIALLESEGVYRVELHLDDAPLISLPLNVVVSGLV